MRLLEAIRGTNSVLADQLTLEYSKPNHYQDRLAEFLKDVRPNVVVETGVATGISSERILSALDDLEGGVLHSIDLSPRAGLFEVDHPRWHKHRASSQDVLHEIYAKTGPWDVFLHDSDHGAFCQTFEYEMAWQFVRPGGYILSDDYLWGDPPHGAWQTFCSRHGLAFDKLGGCAIAHKSITAPRCVPRDSAAEALSAALRMARMVAL